MANNEKNSDGVRAVDRALEILMAFKAGDYELSASELLTRVDLSRPTLYRLLYTLEQNGFLTSSGDPQKFRLGPAIAHLSHVWSSSLDLAAIAQPFMRKMWEQTGETVALFVPQGVNRLCIAEMPSIQPLSFKRGLGYREQLARGASGRAILAYLVTSKEMLQSYLAGIALDVDAYYQDLVATRERGYATSENELIEGAVAVAVPFFSGEQKAAGSIGIFGPSVRMRGRHIEDIAALLQAASRELSHALGYR